MRTLMWKLRIATLWVFYAVGMVLLFFFVLMEPGTIDDVRSGTVEGMPTTGTMTLEMLIWVMGPLALAFLTFVLKDSVGRWVNLIMGALFGLSMVFDVVGHMGSVMGAPIVAILTVVSGLLIAVIAWMKPKPVTTTTAHPEDALAS